MKIVEREEKKYLLNIYEITKLKYMLDSLLQKDIHNALSGYMVRSLYFDTIYEKDYFDKENGLELRRKIRLRCYDPNAEYVNIEIKQKVGSNQLKRSLRISREHARSIIAKDYSPLLSYNDSFADECYGIMTTECYLPKVVIEYNRIAYIGNINNTRITLDSKVCVNEANFNIFDSNLPLYPVLDEFNWILEVKYNNFLVSYIKDLISKVDKSELSISKYCLARNIL